MTKEEIKALQEQFYQDMTANKDRVVNLRIKLPKLFMIAAQVQLALRHPSNTGESAEVARRFVTDMIAEVCPTEAIKKVMTMGFDPQHDVERGGGWPISSN